VEVKEKTSKSGEMGVLKRIAGPVVTAVNLDAHMYDVVKVGREELMGLVALLSFEPTDFIFRQRNQLHVSNATRGNLSRCLRTEQQPAFLAQGDGAEEYLALLADKNVWVKVSGADRITRQGPPYSDAVPFARKLVAEFGDRCVWGTDWPHPNHQGPIPDDGMLVDILAGIATSETARQALLVDNPKFFYRFAPARRLTGAIS
jgi:hypothetical protein